MRQMTKVLLVLMLVMCSQIKNADAQENEEKESNSSISGFPILGYSPETGYFGGAAVPYFFRPSGSSSEDRPTIISPMVIYTQEKQFVFEVNGDMYFKQKEYYLHSNLKYKKYPEKFFGIGYNAADKFEELYISRGPSVNIDFFKMIRDGLYAGIKMQYSEMKYDDFEADGLLANGDYTGEAGGIVSGMGIQINIDDRDNIIYPSNGKYVKIAAVLIDDLFGSDYSYNYFFVNGSKYLSVSSKNVLAFNTFFQHMSGDVPFTKLAGFHNDTALRGYHGNYYRDMNGASFQAELRNQLTNRFGIVLFAGAGQVAHEISGFRMDNFKPCGGFGARIKLIPKENLNLRIDMAYGHHSDGFYIDAAEAF